MTATTPPPAADALRTELRDLLGERVVVDADAIRAASHDHSNFEPDGPALALVLAESTEDVSRALAWANAHTIPVSVRGSGTGVSGGAGGYAGGLIISLERMNRVLRLDVENRLADVQPGVINADLDALAREEGLFFPPDPASADISSVGGNISTNAGGFRCIAYGVTGDSVAALEVVLADGRVIRTGARTRKNVVGLDLTHLFVGAEGTLGVVTEATVRLKPVPPGQPQYFSASFDDIESASAAVTAIVSSATTPEILELIDAQSAAIIEAYKPSGLPTVGAALLIGKTVGSDASAAAEAITAICRDHGAVDVDVTDSDALLEARKLSNPALAAQGLRLGCDVGVPIGELAAVFHGINEIAQRRGRRISIVAHAGDGNLHPTVEAANTPDDQRLGEEVIDDIVRLALALGGTISGEHGIGALKVAELPKQLSADTLAAERAIKAALDPNGILSPGRAI